MKISDFARRLPDEVWAAFEPVLPSGLCGAATVCPPIDKPQLSAWTAVRVGERSRLGDGFRSASPVERPSSDGLKIWLERDCFRQVWKQLAERYAELEGINWDKVLIDGSKHKAQKGAKLTGPSPVDRAKGGTAVHLATDERGHATGARRSLSPRPMTASKTGNVLCNMVIQPPRTRATPPVYWIR